MIQTCWRVRQDQQRYRKMRASAIVVQTVMRGALQRPRYRKALKEQIEEAKLENQLLALQRKLEEAEAKREQAERNAEARARAALQEQQRQREEAEMLKARLLEESKKKEETGRLQAEPSGETRKVSPPTANEPEEVGPLPAHEESENASELEREIQLQEEQQRLMDESGRMLEYLRKEVFKLRTQNQQLKRDFDLLKDNNQRLMDANASAGASFAALNQHAKQMSKQNGQLTKEVELLKGQNHKLNIVQVELKDELKMKQASYIAEVQSRLQYQKSLQKVTDMIQEKCRDHRLVEKVLQVADECEMDYLDDGGGGHHHHQQHRVAPMGDPDLDEPVDEAALNSSRGLLGFFFR
jgi:myosin heavy subunit